MMDPASGGRPAPIPCAHCQQPVPSSLVKNEPASSFCCSGCENVYALLRGAGLPSAPPGGEAPGPVPEISADFSALDNPEFTQRYTRTLADGSRCVDLYLEGVHCPSCIWLIEHLPRLNPGCYEARLDYSRSRVSLRQDPGVPLSSLARTLATLGYHPHPWRQSDVSMLRQKEDRALWMRIGVAAAVWMNVMFLAIALYSGEYNGIEPWLEQLFRWASLLVFLPSVLWCAQPFFIGAWASLRTRVLHMDLPLAIGIGVGSVASVFRVVLGRGDLYFDSLAMLIFLLLVARWLQRRGTRRAGEAAELLQALTSATARVLEPTDTPDGATQETLTPVEALLPGMQVEVRSGESIPADGLVVRGNSFLNRAVLSGESAPEAVKPGDEVFAGTLNLEAPLVILLTATGEATRIGKVMRLMEEASARRAPIVAMADRLVGTFVATILGLSVLTGVGWSLVEPTRALEHVIALLIVTCPCALGMATPVALAVGIGRAASQGILIKGGDAVERLASVQAIYLDKTGTLTQGRLSLVSFEGADEARDLLVGLERSSGHPLARAVAKAWPDVPGSVLKDTREVIGGGLEALQSEQEDVVRAGSRQFLESKGIRLDSEWASRLDAVLERALTPVLVARGERVCGLAAFGDPLREDSKEAILRLKALGIEPGILSGDHPAVVAAIGKELGLDPARVFGGLSPEQKLLAIEAAVKRVPTVMVGDGVNDAAALSAATVGISVHGGAEASLAAADVFLAKPGLLPVVASLEGARATLAVVRRNLGFSIGYNALGATLAVLGWMGPLLAALLMPFSSLTVVGSSVWGGGFRGRSDTHKGE